MRNPDGTLLRIRHRVTGPSVLLRRLRACALGLRRFAEHRAATDAERLWANDLHDRLLRVIQSTEDRERAQ